MNIVGCDFHPGWQQIAVFDTETGEIQEHKLSNGDSEAERFYRDLPSPAVVGLEASGNSQWLEDLLGRLGHEVWVGDAAQIRASYVRKQQTDKRDAAHILHLLIASGIACYGQLFWNREAVSGNFIDVKSLPNLVAGASLACSLSFWGGLVLSVVPSAPTTRLAKLTGPQWLAVMGVSTV